MVLLVSPKEVEVGCVVVGRVECEAPRRSVKRVTWARARVEERVPMRRVCGVEVEGSGWVDVEPEVEVDRRGWGEVAEG